MEISRIYVTVDNVDYRLLGSEIGIELSAELKEMILKSLLTSKINHIERNNKVSPPQNSKQLAIADKVVSPRDHPVAWRYYDDLLISQKLEKHNYITHDKNGKKLDVGSNRLNLNIRTKDLICQASNNWVERNKLSDELFKLPDVCLSKSSIQVYLADLEKTGFLESAVDKNLNKCVRINKELYKA